MKGKYEKCKPFCFCFNEYMLRAGYRAGIYQL